MTWCSVKVLDKGDLSVYTLFSQIGGMLIPALTGILFYAEPLTWQRAACMLMVIAATVVGRPPKGPASGKKQTSAIWWYLAVFTLNGVWGVFAKMHQSAPEMAVSGSMYSLMIRILIILISGVMLLPMFLRREKLLAKPGASCAYAAGGGVLNAIGNLILLEALLHVDASIQYPIVTGGMLVLTVVIDRISGRKPTCRTLLSTVIAFSGLLMMVF